MATIYSAVDLSGFSFTPRNGPFNWRLLHGVDADELVRLNDRARLEGLIETLKQGSADADADRLSPQNYAQLFRLLQLAVEHLWQMRESHARLYPAYAAAIDAADSWRAAAAAYLAVGGCLVGELQGEPGAVLMAPRLAEVAAAREALEKADGAYSSALEQLEAEDAAARCHALRRQRLEICWRVIFGLDLQQLLITGQVGELEQLLPQVAYGALQAEDPAGLTRAHFWQLLALGQACLDYLHAICRATSSAMEAQVQQLAAASGPISELTTACEELHGVLAAALGSMALLPASPGSCTATPEKQKQRHRAAVVPRACSPAASPVAAAATCQHVAQRQAAAAEHSPCCRHHHSAAALRCSSCSPVPACCCHCSGGPAHASWCSAGGSCSMPGALLGVGPAPAAGRLQLRMDQLDRDLRVERERTESMRRALDDMAAMLQQLPSPRAQQPQQQVQPPPPQPPPPHEAADQLQPLQPPPPPVPHSINVPVTVSIGEQQPQPSWPSSPPDSPSGGVRVLINEDMIRAQEREAASQQLVQHIRGIMLTHPLAQRARGTSKPGGKARAPLSFASVPSPSSRGASMGGGSRIASSAGASWQWPAPGTAPVVSSGGSGPGGCDPAAIAAAMLHYQQLVQQQQQQLQPQAPSVRATRDLQPPAAAAAPTPGDSSLLAAQAAAAASVAAAQAAAAGAAAAMWQDEPARGEAGEAGSGTGTADPSMQAQQALFKEAAAGGFRKLLRSVSPKRMFAGSGSGSGSKAGSPRVPAAAAAAAAASPPRGPAGRLGSFLLGGPPAAGASSPAGSPTRSGSSFTAHAAAKAAAEVAAAAALSPLTPQAAVAAYSPLKVNIAAGG